MRAAAPGLRRWRRRGGRHTTPPPRARRRPQGRGLRQGPAQAGRSQTLGHRAPHQQPASPRGCPPPPRGYPPATRGAVSPPPRALPVGVPPFSPQRPRHGNRCPLSAGHAPSGEAPPPRRWSRPLGGPGGAGRGAVARRAGGARGAARSGAGSPSRLVAARRRAGSMALSVPVNGLKDGDKEPVIELFVKVKGGGEGVCLCVCEGGGVPSRRRARTDRWAPPPPSRRFPAPGVCGDSKFPSASC